MPAINAGRPLRDRVLSSAKTSETNMTREAPAKLLEIKGDFAEVNAGRSLPQ